MIADHERAEELTPWPEPERMPADLKCRINSLLWTLLPPSMSLGEAEDVAAMLDARIRDAWRLHESKQTPSAR